MIQSELLASRKKNSELFNGLMFPVTRLQSSIVSC